LKAARSAILERAVAEPFVDIEAQNDLAGVGNFFECRLDLGATPAEVAVR
jgi:hypothetical protein